jgi:hypothetical protein
MKVVMKKEIVAQVTKFLGYRCHVSHSSDTEVRIKYEILIECGHHEKKLYIRKLGMIHR